MIASLQRWAGIGEKPDYAGPLSYGGAPYTQDAAFLEGADVAIVGAPMDELVSDRPGARFAPRAIRAASCPPGPQLEAGLDALRELRVVDFGDAPVIPADSERSPRGCRAPRGGGCCTSAGTCRAGCAAIGLDRPNSVGKRSAGSRASAC